MLSYKAIPLEKFMCYKDPNGKRSVHVFTAIGSFPKEGKEEDIFFDGVYKLTLIKPYTENGKNPEIEILLDGSTTYNISWVYRDYISDTDIPVYELKYYDDGVSFNYITNTKYKTDPNFKSKLNNYCQCFDQEIYNTVKDIYEDYSKMEVEPDETDDPIAMIQDPDNIFDCKRYDYLEITDFFYRIEIDTRFEEPETKVSITTSTKNFITKFIDKNEDPIHYGYRFEAIKDDDDNIVWQYSIMELRDGDPVVVGTPQIVNLADFYLKVTGDVYETDNFDLTIDKVIEHDRIFIPFILDVEPYISD